MLQSSAYCILDIYGLSYTAPYNVLSYTGRVGSECTDHSAGHSIRQSTHDAAGRVHWTA